jgi:curli biogenesis system outer membrane secretion channel CsgG
MKKTLVAVLCGVALIASIAGCQRTDSGSSSSSAASASAPAAPAASTPGAGAPDVGRVESVVVTTTGLGQSPAEAVDQALRQAITQVNGLTIDLSSTQFKAVLGLAVGRDPLSLSSAGFAELVSERSRGAVTNFKIVELKEPGFGEHNFKATIEASVAKFQAAADKGKLRIAIAPIRVSSSLNLGPRIAADLHQRLTDALTQTGRFTVLERGTNPELDDEMERITDGQTSSGEVARLGQGLGADLIWFGSVGAFDSGARSDNPSAGAGRWSVSQKFVNVTTSEVLFSNTASGDSGAASGDRVSAMEDAIVKRALADILVRLYPVSVASITGHDVVLSQGGESVQVGKSYQLVMLGKEVTDPQTGRSLGRTDQECCTVVVDRVTPTLSYGHLENVKIKLEDVPAGALQLRDEIPAVAAPASGAKATVKRKGGARKDASLGPPQNDSNW